MLNLEYDERYRMSKPRTFISSTCFDFADARAAVAEHLKTLGHEPIRSDTAEFGVSLGKHSHEACLDQVDNCDYLVLLIGGRRGGTFVGSEQSITNEEYRRALKKRKPVITFVKRDVEVARGVYKKNPKADFSGVVDDVRVFDFIDLVTSQSENNWIKVFDNVEDIKRALTDQFAYIALEYSKALVASRDPKSATKDKPEVVRFPAQLAVISDSDNSAEAATKITGLRGLHTVLSGIIKSPAAGKDEKLKLLWVMGRYGQMKYGPPIYISNDRFKQYAWSIAKGKRVFEQIRDFNVIGDYDDDGNGSLIARIGFQSDSDDGEIAYALQQYVSDLAAKFGDDGLELFRKADMTLYA